MASPKQMNDMPKALWHEETNSMSRFKVRKKGAVKQVGMFGQLKFYAEVSDDIQSHKCMFDGIHRDAFNIGDVVSIEFTQKNVWPVSYTHLTLPTKRIV